MTSDDLNNSLRDLAELLDQANVPWFLIGAMSLAFYGQGRATRDIDVMVDAADERLREIIDNAAALGFHIDDSVSRYDPNVAALQTRLRRGQIPVDLLHPRDPHDQMACQRRIRRAFGAGEVWLAAGEDLILQKLKAGRPHDFDDVIPFFGMQREALDHEYLNHWASQLGLREELDYLWSQSE